MEILTSQIKHRNQDKLVVEIRPLRTTSELLSIFPTQPCTSDSCWDPARAARAPVLTVLTVGSGEGHTQLPLPSALHGLAQQSPALCSWLPAEPPWWLGRSGGAPGVEGLMMS